MMDVVAAWEGGGGGGTQESFIEEGSVPRSKPLSFYIPFSTERVPLSHTYSRNNVSLLVGSVRGILKGPYLNS